MGETAIRYDETEVLVEKQGKVAIVRLARPPVNAYNRSMYNQTRRTFEKLGQDPDVNCILLAAEGRVFCGGNDLHEFVDFSFDEATEHLAYVRVCLNAMYDCPIPIVGAINGAAVGTGFALASLCDIRVVGESVIFALPEIDVGVMGGSRHAMRIAPQGMTRLMMYTGRRITAAQALAANMIEEMVADDEVMPRAFALAEEIASKNPIALRFAKEGLNRVESMNLKEGYEFECTLTAGLRRVADIGEAAAQELARRSRANVRPKSD